MFSKILGLSLVAAVSAHQNFHQFWVNDVTPGYQVGIRMPPSNSPVTDVTSDDIVCNVNGSIVPSGVTTVAANEGDSITVNWDESGHPGPITHFLFGPVDDAAQETGIGAGWFKIDERDYVNGSWANEYLEANGGNYTFKLPTGLQSGDYLLRSEMLALHAAQTVGGAQFYIGCAQLTITGTGSSSCSPSISLPGAYTAEDDDIYIPDVYNGFDPTTYTAPGGDVAACGAGSSPATTAAASSAATSVAASATSAAAATSSATAAASSVSSAVAVATSSAAPVAVASTTSTVAAATTVASSAAPTETASDDGDDGDDDESCDPEESETASVAVPTSTFVTRTSTRATASATSSAKPAVSSSSSSSGSSSGSVALYGQCGGTNYSGATTCASGTCTFQNDYYSQCV